MRHGRHAKPLYRFSFPLNIIFISLPDKAHKIPSNNKPVSLYDNPKIRPGDSRGECGQLNVHKLVNKDGFFKVARLDFLGAIPPKFEHYLRRH